jgi:hypothetical protein
MNAGTQATRAGQMDHLRTLEDVVADYCDRFRRHLVRSVERSDDRDDPVVDVCREAPTFREAISRAVDGRRRDGKVFQQDSCVRLSSKAEFKRRLLLARRAIKAARNFDRLHDLVGKEAPWGCGPLIVYNVACRIGAYMGMEPHDFLYLHAGPMAGWKRLTGTRRVPAWVPREELPPALLALPIHHVENLLCEYRDFLHPGLVR